MTPEIIKNNTKIRQTIVYEENSRRRGVPNSYIYVATALLSGFRNAGQCYSNSQY